MFRPLFAITAAFVAAAPAAAATYSAKPAVPTSERFIARDIIWACGPAACQGATDEGRPAVLCQALAKRAGRIESFLVDGRAFSPAQLDKCNTAAKASSNPALGAQ
ncbi:MAG: CC_3452 family protein [Sphingomicrobium sp.]